MFIALASFILNIPSSIGLYSMRFTAWRKLTKLYQRFGIYLVSLTPFRPHTIGNSVFCLAYQYSKASLRSLSGNVLLNGIMVSRTSSLAEERNCQFKFYRVISHFFNHFGTPEVETTIRLW